MTSVYKFDPIQDNRWQKLIERHPGASVFHCAGWLEALRRTYAYEPVSFTTSSPMSELTNALIFCRVKSCLTGQRLVSLPFSDHCEPLTSSLEEVDFLVRYLQAVLEHEKWKYFEFRPVSNILGKIANPSEFHPSQRYRLHRLNLEPKADELFKSFDKDSIQRRIRRAERAGLVEKCGRDGTLLRDFYGLLVITRSRHHIPPQPYAWFENLIKCFGEALDIRVAYKGQTPIAAILTLRFKDTVYYKYGCSDKAFNHLGATPLLLWEAIYNAKSEAAKTFDFGRTDEDNPGLIAFKDKWGTQSQMLVYCRFSGSQSLTNGEEWKVKMFKHVCAYLPDRVLVAAGNLLYRHIG